MGESFEGMLIGKGLKFGLVVSRFNEFIAKKLLEGAQDALHRHGVNDEDVDTAWVPGSLEIPLVALKMANSDKYNAIICLGAVVRGGTPHFEYVSAELSRGISKVAFSSGLPITNGVITAETLEQAIERAGTKMGNKGFDAAVNAIEMANLLKSLV